MLDELLTALADVTDTVGEACGPCADSSPNPAPTLTGSAGSAGSSGDPGGDPGNDPGNDPGDDPGDDGEWHEEPGHEQRLQRENAQSTAEDLVSEYVTSPTGNLGKVAGPLVVVASGSEALGEGISTIKEANRLREERVYQQSGGEVGSPPSQNDPGRAPDGASDDADASGDGHDTTREDTPGRRKADEVMENLEIKRQMQEQGNAGDESWKQWR